MDSMCMRGTGRIRCRDHPLLPAAHFFLHVTSSCTSPCHVQPLYIPLSRTSPEHPLTLYSPCFNSTHPPVQPLYSPCLSSTHPPVQPLLEQGRGVPQVGAHTSGVSHHRRHTQWAQAALHLITKQHVGQLAVLVVAAAPLGQEQLKRGGGRGGAAGSTLKVGGAAAGAQ